MNSDVSASPRPRVVVVGGGFAGLNAVKHLRHVPVDVTLVDRQNFHLFQPLTYQVATGALAPEQVAFPLRAVFRSAPNVTVLLAEVSGFDLAARLVHLAPVDGVAVPRVLPYDMLIVAAGSRYSYFGRDEWADAAPDVKSLDNALAVRARIVASFERAAVLEDPARRRAQLSFVVVGGGPTGVEIAGQISQVAHDMLQRDFPHLNPDDARVILVEAGDRLLATFPVSLATKATLSLYHLGVTPMLTRTVVGIDHDGVDVRAADGSTERVEALTVIWAAGVHASELAGELSDLAEGEVDRAGRLTVAPDLSLPGHPEVFAAGDMVRVRSGSGEVVTLPGLAPVAIQQGRYAARAVRNRVRGRPTPPFHYVDKGNVATIGRARAIADLHGLRLSGLPAWFIWLGVHVWYLIGFDTRLTVLIRWFFNLVKPGRAIPLIRVAGEKVSQGTG